MGTVSVHLDAAPDRVFDVLADGWLYTGWVVGASHIRAVEPAWPQVGARIHHAVGAWPLLLRDETTVERCDPPYRLVLTAKGRPLGQARVDLQLAAEGAGTCVTMTESVVSGPGRLVPAPVLDALINARNRESLARLSALAAQPGRPAS